MAEASGPGSRIAALDVLQGIAILGTFASNAWLFASPGGPAAMVLNGIDAGGAVETVLRALSNGKFLALLTLLFGVGLELQYRSQSCAAGGDHGTSTTSQPPWWSSTR